MTHVLGLSVSTGESGSNFDGISTAFEDRGIAVHSSVLRVYCSSRLENVSEQLTETINELRTQLQSLEHLDEEDRRKLREALEEIRESLDQDHIDSGGLAKSLHQLTEQFSDAHPRLTETAGRFADMLAQMGI